MSDYIPFDIQAKIMKNLPSKSLIQFRSVSKAWKSLIDSFEFIADHHRHTHQRHNYLLVRDPEHKYVSFVDDDTFPQHKFSLTLSMSAELHNKPMILGSSQGLFCLYGNHVGTQSYSETETAAIWNPAIRKLVDIGQLPHVDGNMNVTTVGFGVCPHTLDPKIVTVSIPWLLTDNTGTWQVEVFRLSLGAWTSLSINLLPGIALTGNQVAIDRFIYWPASHTSGVDVIISFDLTSEEFTYIYLPDVLTSNYHDEWEIFKLKESLVVLQSYYDGPDRDYDVWIMENGVQKSFKKIYTIKFNISYEDTSVLEFKNNGEAIVLISDDYELCEAFDLPHQNHLFVYKPNSRRVSSIRFASKEASFFVSSYAETLLLLDH
ncbi:putative F-box domain-containing protein [Tanacetum coccineum]